MRLKRVTLRNFRAFSNAEEPAIDLDHSVVLFCGKNGAGKTSLFEALELTLTGAIERLAAAQAKGRILVNVRKPDAPARIALEWERGGIDGATSVEIDRNQPSVQIDPALLKDQIGSFPVTTYLPQATLRRLISAGPLKLGEIIGFLAATERSEALLDGIAQAEITRRDAAYQRMKEACDREQKTVGDTDARIKFLRGTIELVRSETGGIGSWLENILDISRKLELPVPSLTAPSVDGLSDQVKSVDEILQSKLADAIQFKSRAERANVNCQRLIDQEEDQKNTAQLFFEKEYIATTRESGLRDLENRLKTKRNNLTTIESEAINGQRIPAMLKLLIDAKSQAGSNICPICDRPLENLTGHIEYKLKNLTAEQPELESRLARTRASLELLENLRRQMNVEIAEIKKEISDRRDEEQTLLKGMGDFLSDYRTIIGNRCSLQQVSKYLEGRVNEAQATITSLTGLADRASRLRSEISAASTRTSTLSTELKGLEGQRGRFEKRLAEANAAKQIVESFIETTQWLQGILSKELEEVLSTYANTYVSMQFAELFHRICGHEYWGVAIPEARMRYRRAEVDWNATYRGEVYQGEAVFSQGELNACALAMFLALATAQSEHPKFLLLDDPIQSMDEMRIDDFAQVLKSLKDDLGWQLLIAIHEESVFEYLKRQLYPSSEGQSLASYKLVADQGGTIASEKQEFVFDAKDFLIPASDMA